MFLSIPSDSRELFTLRTLMNEIKLSVEIVFLSIFIDVNCSLFVIEFDSVSVADECVRILGNDVKSRHLASGISRIIRFYLFFGIYRYIRVADGVETSLNREYKIGNDILAKTVRCTTEHFENFFRKKREKKLIEILLVFSLWMKRDIVHSAFLIIKFLNWNSVWYSVGTNFGVSIDSCKLVWLYHYNTTISFFPLELYNNQLGISSFSRIITNNLIFTILLL